MSGGVADREMPERAAGSPRCTLSGGRAPLAGEEFGAAAVRLSGLAGVLFGWTPEVFWTATPAELAALAGAVRGEDGTAVDRQSLARMMKEMPDG